jgi:magnesium transporter
MNDTAPLSSRRRQLRGYGVPGSPPGTLRRPSDASETSIEAIGYDKDYFERIATGSHEDIVHLQASCERVWINVSGLADIDLIREIAGRFSLHDLALEDVFHTQQRPKSEEYENHQFVVARIPLTDDFPHTEQIALFVGDAFVVCFQERSGDCFDGVRNRIADPDSQLRSGDSGFLAYALIDSVIDSYFPVLERLGEELETVESAVLSRHDVNLMARLHKAKRNVVELRRTIWRHREMVNSILRDEPRAFNGQTLIYLRDCYDHVAQLMDIVESDREFVSDLFDVHLSRINLRMNEIMKFLTAIATVFIPLSFIASVYGMNFDRTASPWNMPELGWAFEYAFALGLMVVVAGLLLLFLYRRGWLSPAEEPRRGRRGGRRK